MDDKVREVMKTLVRCYREPKECAGYVSVEELEEFLKSHNLFILDLSELEGLVKELREDMDDVGEGNYLRKYVESKCIAQLTALIEKAKGKK